MSDRKRTIRVTCDCRDTLPFEALETFQGGLKKRTDDDYRRIRESVEKHGFAAPFFVWKDNGRNRLLDGTGRYETLERMRREGYKLPLLPVVYLRPKDEAEARELLLKITSRYGKVSSLGLEAFLNGLRVDVESLGLDVFIKPDDLPAALGIIPRTRPEPVTAPGDVWELRDEEGRVRHRLVCGDACRDEAWAALMSDGTSGDDTSEDGRAALLFTDPPYGVDYEAKIKKLRKAGRQVNKTRAANGGSRIAGDDSDGAELELLWRTALGHACRRLRDDAAFYVCGGSFPDIVRWQLMAMTDAGLPPRHLIIWAKDAPTFSIGRLDYNYQHELIWYGWKKTRHFYGRGKCKTALWNMKRPQKSGLHPTMKPPELAEEAIKNSMEPLDGKSEDLQSVEKTYNGVINSARKDDVVLDPFAGSGSVLAACEKLKRRAFMIEIEPRYCDAIVLRGLGINPCLTAFRRRGGAWEAVPKSELERGTDG